MMTGWVTLRVKKVKFVLKQFLSFNKNDDTSDVLSVAKTCVKTKIPLYKLFKIGVKQVLINE